MFLLDRRSSCHLIGKQVQQTETTSLLWIPNNFVIEQFLYVYKSLIFKPKNKLFINYVD